LKTKHVLAVMLAGLWVFGAAAPVGAQSEPMTHTVVKGDTLWDICEAYYGNPFLWPKLWEMNSFVTNPHLLKPGDTITLLKGVPLRKQPPPPQIKPAAAVPEKKVPVPKGVDISSLTDIEAIGMLGPGSAEPDGRIIADEKEGFTVSEGDLVYVQLHGGRTGHPGDLYTVCRTSPALRHPATQQPVGVAYAYLAKLELLHPIENQPGVWKCKLVRGSREVSQKDLVFRHQPLSACIEPLPAERRITSRIVAVKEQRDMIGQYSVVYLSQGYNQGIRRGNLFDIVVPNQASENRKIVLPDILLGHLLIVESLPGTAAGLVIDSRKEIANGALVKSTDWEVAQEILSRLPVCPLD
jgi:hypothetical protein